MSLDSLQPPPTPIPSHDDILVAWAMFQGNPGDLIVHFNITPTQFLALLADPAFVEKKAHWDALQLAHLHTLALQHQVAAADKLRELMRSADPIEARKAATSLARWWPGPPQGSKSSRSRASSASPNRTTIDYTPNQSPDPKSVVTEFVSRMRRTAEKDRTANAAQLLPQLSPAVMLDNRPVRPGTLADSTLFSQRFAASCLGELCQPGEVTVKQHKTTETTTHLQAVCVHESQDDLVIDFELARDGPHSPWLITAISGPNSPPPRAASP